MPGDCIEYEAIYDIPYIGVGFRTKDTNNWSFTTNISYSPWANIEDEDHHLKREGGNLVSKGEGEGNSFLVNGKLIRRLNSGVNLFLEANYNKTEVEGTQTQYHLPYFGGVIKNIDYQAEQEYTQIELGINWLF